MTKPQKVLIIGSGPIVIGQAAEFDYSGSQACRSLREEGVHTILVNSNPATIMTDEGIADTIYIEPLTVPVIERIIERERPDGLLPTLGGQTGLNLAVALADAGVLEKYNVRVLGTPIATIRAGRGPRAVPQLLLEIGEPVPESADRHDDRGGAPRREGDRPAGRHPARRTRSAAPAAASRTATTSSSTSSAAGSRRRRSTRCWSSATSRAGKRSSTR